MPCLARHFGLGEMAELTLAHWVLKGRWGKGGDGGGWAKIPLRTQCDLSLHVTRLIVVFVHW